jgi:hypothetical protein
LESGTKDTKFATTEEDFKRIPMDEYICKLPVDTNPILFDTPTEIAIFEINKNQLIIFTCSL